MYYRKQKVIQNLDLLSKKNNKIVTSGVFNSIHPGHVNFLRKAKDIQKDSTFIVILHTDKYVKEHKSHLNSLTPLADRVEMLSELICVDYVVIWDGWEDISACVKQIKPQILAITPKSREYSNKGTWRGETWEEVAKVCNAEIVQIELYKNFSSSKI